MTTMITDDESFLLHVEGFDSLTLALEGWFDRNRNELPEALLERVDREFFPMPWDDLSAGGRRSVALQLDYQRDPETEQDRQFWWDFFERLHDLQAQAKKWESAATPTASDISLKESRLKELQQELERMKLQQRQAHADYYPKHKNLGADKASAQTTTDYIAFPKAMKILAERLGAKPEELAAWIFIGPDKGGIAAYRNANELNQYPRFFFDCFMGEDYLSPLMACCFRQDDIDRFDPADRYMTGAALIERWSCQPGLRPEAFILAKIAESRLLDIHPTLGGTQGTHGDKTSFPPLSSGLFAMSQIEQIETDDALDPVQILPDSDFGPGAARPVNNPTAARSAPVEDAYAAFRRLESLHPSEISIAIVGATSESGLSGNNMLEISARGITRRMALAEFDLVDRRTGSLTRQAAVLVGLAHRRKFVRSEEKNSAIMTRLRAEFRKHLGVKADPFTKYDSATGWQPIFSIVDHRDRSDARAKVDAEQKTVSFDQLEKRGQQFAAAKDDDTVEYDDDDGDGDAERWLKENDSDRLR
jgi:hypothetical protein